MAMKKLFGKLVADIKGATAIEYGLILALIALATMGALIAVASSTVNMWNNVTTQVRDAG
jgi:pilus assembly protein Flp/PilA